MKLGWVKRFCWWDCGVTFRCQAVYQVPPTMSGDRHERWRNACCENHSFFQDDVGHVSDDVHHLIFLIRRVFLPKETRNSCSGFLKTSYPHSFATSWLLKKKLTCQRHNYNTNNSTHKSTMQSSYHKMVRFPMLPKEPSPPPEYTAAGFGIWKCETGVMCIFS